MYGYLEIKKYISEEGKKFFERIFFFYCLLGLIKARGQELLRKVSQIVGGLLKNMEGIKNEQTMNGSVRYYFN